jgi:GTP-binding protein
VQYNSPLATLPVEFVGSFPDPTHRLAPVLPEIVTLGRSNVGKSSLLNALFDRPLAKVSGTPGRTALLNVFRLPGLYLLDLPGYGYAKVSHSERARYGRLVKTLIEQRNTITGVLATSRILRRRSMPSERGMRRSVTTRSGSDRR